MSAFLQLLPSFSFNIKEAVVKLFPKLFSYLSQGFSELCFDVETCVGSSGVCKLMSSVGLCLFSFLAGF